jgi:formate/nitrite transporter FocA (FNT family)
VDPDAQVSQEEAEQAHQRERPRSAVIFETIRAEGETELERSSGSLFFSALAAGLSMVFSMIAMGVLRAGLPDTPGRPLVAGFGYTLGFLIVILGRQQLFTENTLTPLLPLFARPTVWRVRQLGRLWAVILFGNLVGAAISSALVAFAGAFPPETMRAFDALAVETTAHPFLVTFTKAIFAGWLIALMVWLIPLAEGSTPLIIILLTYVVAAGQFQHIIAGSVEALYGAYRGVTSWADGAGFFVPTLLGNIVGGVAFVAAVSSAEIAAERHARKAKPPA